MLREGTAVVGCLLPHGDPLAPRILCYHGVSEMPLDEWSVTPSQFCWQMTRLSEERTPVSLMEIVRWITGGPKPPPGAVAVTFDDGFLDVFKRAAPIMAKLNIPGTAFICPELMAQKNRVADVCFKSKKVFMNWDQVRVLHDAGWTIGSHSMNHAILSSLSAEESKRQIQRSQAIIVEEIGAACPLIAYPYGTPGTVSEREANFCLEAGYQNAFMNVTGLANPEADPFMIPRTKILGSDSRFVFRRSLDGSMDLWRIIEDRG